MLGFIERDLERQRKELAERQARQNRELVFPQGVCEAQGIPYRMQDKPCHRMDVYWPAEAGGPLPVIVNFHGGGLLLGDRSINRYFCGELAKRGFLVFCAEYPLVPESDVYGILKDASAALTRVGKLLEQYHGDPRRIYLVGDSAGALICVYLAAMLKSRAVACAVNARTPNLDIRALGLISGMFYTAKPDSIGIFLTRYFYGAKWRSHPFKPYRNPEHPQIVGSLPPCMLITSEADNLRRYTMWYEQALAGAGVEHKLVDYGKDPRLTHAFVCMEPQYPESQDSMDQLTAFLLAHGPKNGK